MDRPGPSRKRQREESPYDPNHTDPMCFDSRCPTPPLPKNIRRVFRNLTPAQKKAEEEEMAAFRAQKEAERLAAEANRRKVKFSTDVEEFDPPSSREWSEEPSIEGELPVGGGNNSSEESEDEEMEERAEDAAEETGGEEPSNDVSASEGNIRAEDGTETAELPINRVVHQHEVAGGDWREEEEDMGPILEGEDEEEPEIEKAEEAEPAEHGVDDNNDAAVIPQDGVDATEEEVEGGEEKEKTPAVGNDEANIVHQEPVEKKDQTDGEEEKKEVVGEAREEHVEDEMAPTDVVDGEESMMLNGDAQNDKHDVTPAEEIPAKKRGRGRPPKKNKHEQKLPSVTQDLLEEVGKEEEKVEADRHVEETGQIHDGPVNTPRKRGRPPGAPNKPKMAPPPSNISRRSSIAAPATLKTPSVVAPATVSSTPPGKRRGRPPGSPNKPKVAPTAVSSTPSGKRKGRPPGSGKKAGSVLIPTPSSIKKRGPRSGKIGTPKKSPPSQVNGEKRGRGRPRKAIA